MTSGHGSDSYRFWEILAMGSVPVVASSSLDRLYKQFPVVILQNWSVLTTVTNADLAAWRADIQERFPKFAAGRKSSEVDEKMALSFWVGLIRDTHAAALEREKQTPIPTVVMAAAREGWEAGEAFGDPQSQADMRKCCYDDHGWQSSCNTSAEPNCTLLTADELRKHSAMPRSILTATAKATIAKARDAQRTADPYTSWLHGAITTPRPGTNLHLAGKVLRVRTPTRDGFWVRALFAIAHGMWASQMGIAFYIDPHVNASCGEPDTACSVLKGGLRAPSGEKCRQGGVCDAYYDPLEGGNAWEQHFEPVSKLSSAVIARDVPSSKIVEVDGVTAWVLFASFTGGKICTFHAGSPPYDRTIPAPPLQLAASGLSKFPCPLSLAAAHGRSE